MISVKETLRVFLFLLLLSPACSQEISQSAYKYFVINVSDGDTVTLLDKETNEKIRVRLHGIDCPESKQAFGTRAKQFTHSLCYNQYVQLVPKTKDRYGRVVGEILLQDGRNLNQEIVKAGYAWHYRAYSNDLNLQALEDAAKEAKLGLWADVNPIAPWDWRKMQAENRAKNRNLKKEYPKKQKSKEYNDATDLDNND